METASFAFFILRTVTTKIHQNLLTNAIWRRKGVKIGRRLQRWMHDYVDVSIARQNENGIKWMFSRSIQSIISRSRSNEAMHGKSVGKLKPIFIFFYIVLLFISLWFCNAWAILTNTKWDSPKRSALPIAVFSRTKSVKSFIIIFSRNHLLIYWIPYDHSH